MVEASTSANALGYFAADECVLTRPVLQDAQLQAEFDDRGYVVVPLVDGTRVSALYERYVAEATSAQGVNPPGAYNDTYAEFSVIHSWPEFRRRAFAHICDQLLPAVDRHLVNYRPILANYVNKPPGTGVVPAHQNFSVVDETQYQSVSVWVALVDCTVENGALWVLDGSHRSLRGRRGLWAYAAFGQIEPELIEMMTPLEVPAGHAVILDDALVHRSPPNMTAQRRLAIQLVMVPQEAEALWFQQVGEGPGEDLERSIEVAVWSIEPGYFQTMWNQAGDERYGRVTGHAVIPTPQLDVDALRALGVGGPTTAARTGEVRPTGRPPAH